MISKIIILAIATGIGFANYIPKGIDKAMNDPKAIEEYQEYEEYAKETIDEELHGDEIIEKFEYILDKYDFATDVQEGEIEAYLDENNIPYERIKDKNGSVLINAEKHGIIARFWYDHLGNFSAFSSWERCTHTDDRCLQENINN